MADDPLASTIAIPEIAIIGGGFSGSILAIQLLRNRQQPLCIHLIERNDAPGRGVAYRDQPECHLLNVRAEAMSPFPDQPDHFLDWLNRVFSPCYPVGVSEFVPRRIYGFYIQSLLDEAAHNARPGVQLVIHADEAIATDIGLSGLIVKLQSGESLRVSHAVLAFGNPGPADPPLADRSFYRSARYLSNAWSSLSLQAVRSTDDLLLIGSGLTTLDWVAALHARRHRGRIVVLSRRGLLPQVHKPAAAHLLSVDLLALPPRILPLFKALRREMEAASAEGTDWRAVIDAVRPVTQSLWQRMSEPEQRRFLRHLRVYWEIHRHRASPAVMNIVQELRQQGQLELLAGRLKNLAEITDGATASYLPRQGGALRELRTHWVINCTGPESNYRNLDHPLIRNLRQQGLIQPDPLGLGVLTDPHGALVTASGEASKQLFTLGPPRKGLLWETTAVPEIRVQAQALAHRLLTETAPAVPALLQALIDPGLAA